MKYERIIFIFQKNKGLINKNERTKWNTSLSFQNSNILEFDNYKWMKFLLVLDFDNYKWLNLLVLEKYNG